MGGGVVCLTASSPRMQSCLDLIAEISRKLLLSLWGEGGGVVCPSASALQMQSCVNLIAEISRKLFLAHGAVRGGGGDVG